MALDPYPPTRRTRRPAVPLLIGAAAVAATLAALLATRGNDGQTSGPSTTDTTPTSATPAAGSSTTSPGGCAAFPDASPEVPAAAPAALWIQRGFVALPVSVPGPHSPSVAGPAVVDADRPLSCFAHTPTGAVFAAVAAGADALYPPVLLEWARERVVGPGRQAAVDAAAAVSPTATSDGRRLQVAAFRVDDCTDDRCAIDVAFDIALPDGTLRTGLATAVMVWAGGDWSYYDDGQPDQPRFVDRDGLEGEGFIGWSPQ